MKKYILLVTAFLAAGITGCKKNFLSQEVNPNAPSVATPSLLLSAALSNSANIVVNDYAGFAVWVGYWTTSGNYVPNTTLNQYQITNGSLNGAWGDWYSNLTNYNNIQVAAAKDPTQANFQAIAMIMKAYGFQHLVDMFGDVPYSQAFQPSTIIFPAYDKGTDVYADLNKQLDAAIALIQKNIAAGVETAPLPGTPDIVFGSASKTAQDPTEMLDWIKFANSLKLRLAMRTSESTTGDGGLSATLSADLATTGSLGYLDGTTEAIANPGYQDVSGKQNPYYSNYGFDANNNPGGGAVYYRANAYEVGVLAAFNDPRATQLFSLVQAPGTPAGTAPSVVRGNVFGDNSKSNLTNTFTSDSGPGLLKSSAQGQPLFSGAESLFLQSEALLDGYNIGTTTLTAQTAYEAAITSSFVDLGAFSYDVSQTPAVALSPAASAAVYYGTSTNNVGWASSTNKQQAIITQKWIALTGNFNFEAWNEYRRTGFPDVPASIDPAKVKPTTPYRVLYPQSELSTNSANLAKEGTIDPFSTKIFWMK